MYCSTCSVRSKAGEYKVCRVQPRLLSTRFSLVSPHWHFPWSHLRSVWGLHAQRVPWSCSGVANWNDRCDPSRVQGPRWCSTQYLSGPNPHWSWRNHGQLYCRQRTSVCYRTYHACSQCWSHDGCQPTEALQWKWLEEEGQSVWRALFNCNNVRESLPWSKQCALQQLLLWILWIHLPWISPTSANSLPPTRQYSVPDSGWVHS